MQSLNLKNIQSSYAYNNYGDVFYYITKSFKPKVVVELGSYQGYSALHIVKALSEQNYNSEFTSVDLYDKYIFKYCAKKILLNNFKKNDLLNLYNVKLNFIQADALKCYDNFTNNSIDLLHIDIVNDADKLEKCFDVFHEKLKLFAIVIFEGGSSERDYNDYMLRYKKSHIRNFIDSSFFQSHYDYLVFKLYPSMTIAIKKKQ